ncbi:MAG: glyoxalase, partial [Marmoricola sp.]|nr:glyoxalase [Marmoricola sp.]
MSLRWYSTVIDCHDIAAQAQWWAETLGWRTEFQDEHEVCLVPPHTAELPGTTPWEQVGPGLVFVPVPEGKEVKNRLHIDLAPHLDDDRDALIEGLVVRGARRTSVGETAEATWTVLL